MYTFLIVYPIVLHTVSFCIIIYYYQYEIFTRCVNYIIEYFNFSKFNKREIQVSLQEKFNCYVMANVCIWSLSQITKLCRSSLCTVIYVPPLRRKTPSHVYYVSYVHFLCTLVSVPGLGVKYILNNRILKK